MCNEHKAGVLPISGGDRGGSQVFLSSELLFTTTVYFDRAADTVTVLVLWSHKIVNYLSETQTKEQRK